MGIYRATFSGALHGAEQFAFGFGITDPTNPALSTLLTDLTTLLTSVNTATNYSASFSTGITYTKLYVAKLSSGITESSAEATLNLAGTNSTVATLPFECSICVSLVCAPGSTLTPPLRRGRFYLPPPVSSTMDTTVPGRWNSAQVTTWSNAWSAAFNTFATTDRKIAVVRQTKPVGGVGGITDAQDVVSFNIGNVPDAQRRRRNKQVETRIGAAIV